MTLLRVLGVAVILAAVMLSAAAEEKRVALLIGNQDYPASVGALSNTHEDVRTMETALQAVGFETTTGFDLDEDGMEDAFDALEDKIALEAEAGHEVIVFFYYSGHGAAAYEDREAKNFLIPAKEEITRASHLFRKGVELDEVLASLQASEAKAIFVVSDACRNELKFAFSKSVADKGMTRVTQRPGMLVAFATAAGETTPDDGLFSKTLAEEIRRPGQNAVVAFYQALAEVSDKRKSSSRPFMAPGKLPRGLCFNGCTSGPVEPVEPTRKAEYWFRNNGDEYSFISDYTLMATVGDLDYEVREFEMVAPQIEVLKDFNGDGTLDAVLSAHGGGNCCPPDYYFAADMGDGHFAVHQIEDIYAWQEMEGVVNPSVEIVQGQWAVRFVSLNEGMNTDAAQQEIHLYTLQNDKPFLISKTLKKDVVAEVEMNSNEFEYPEDLDAPGADLTNAMKYDIDGDGADDTIACGLWERWGRLTGCDITLASGAETITIDANCKRLGVLRAREDGFSKLVCDADEVISYDAANNAYVHPMFADDYTEE